MKAGFLLYSFFELIQAVAALETFTQGNPDTSVYKAASDALKKIREAKPQSAEVGTLRNEVMDLKKQNQELEKKFEELKKQVGIKTAA